MIRARSYNLSFSLKPGHFERSSMKIGTATRPQMTLRRFIVIRLLRSRLVKLLTVLIFVLVFANFVRAEDAPKSQTVQDPRYGLVLWHYFQGQHWDALTELMIAEKQGGIQGHNENPQIIKAALKLAYGMVDESKAAFESVINEDTPESVKNTAWYYLAELNYQRGDLNAALAALDNLAFSQSSKHPISQKSDLLRLDLLIQFGDLVRAEQLISNNKDLLASPISLFNLGNGYSRLASKYRSPQAITDKTQQSSYNSYTKALVYFDQALIAIANLKSRQEEDLLLADKIYTAAGYTALITEQYSLAMSYFNEVQQQSLNTELALLGYGRAASQMEQYPLALSYFDQLAQKAVYKPAVQEGLISVPYVYEQMQRPNTALNAYKGAMSTYQDELNALDAEIEKLSQEDLAAFDFAEEGSHWLSISDTSVSRPRDQKFFELFSESGFQADLRELQDLMHLNNLAVERMERLLMLKETVAFRQGNRKRQWSDYESMEVSDQIEIYSQQLQSRQDKIQRAEANEDYLAFVTPDQKGFLERVENSLARIDNLEAEGKEVTEGKQFKKEKDLLRLYKGILQWQTAQDFAHNLHQENLGLEKINQELQALVENRSRVEEVLYQAPDVQPYIQRLAEIKQSTEAISDKLELKLAEVRSKIFGTMIALLEDRKENLQLYMVKARLASVRIYEEHNNLALNNLNRANQNKANFDDIDKVEEQL